MIIRTPCPCGTAGRMPRIDSFEAIKQNAKLLGSVNDADEHGTDLYLTQSQGFAKVAKDNDLNPKVVRTVTTAYL